MYSDWKITKQLLSKFWKPFLNKKKEDKNDLKHQDVINTKFLDDWWENAYFDNFRYS